jgi:hypothetical protein
MARRWLSVARIACIIPVIAIALATLAVVAILSGAACSAAGRDGGDAPPRIAAMKPIEQVQREHEAAWLDLPGVLGVGVSECDDRPCLKVFVSAPDTTHAGIPTFVDGYPVRIEVTGTIRALDGE